MKYLLWIASALALTAGIVYAVLGTSAREAAQEEPTATERPAGSPTFAWSYRDLGGEIPHTEISLTATYPEGASSIKVIDTVEGTCDALDDADKDAYERSTMIICYYAGLGKYFKVVADSQGYAVERKIFEEGSDEYEPPETPYETIVRF